MPAHPPGRRVPLQDHDRQSLVVRLGEQDCLLRVWWQPSDGAWYGSLEVPIENPVVQGRRIATDAGLLDRLGGVLPGNLVCRVINREAGGAEPARDAWRRGTHGVFYEAN